jgi:hypothetical protein
MEPFLVGNAGTDEIPPLQRRLRSGRTGHFLAALVEPGRQVGSRCR